MSKSLRSMYSTSVPAEGFPETISIFLGDERIDLCRFYWGVGEGEESKRLGMRYGTNPHQPAALYVPKGSIMSEMRLLKSGKEGLSATNVEDGYRALRIVGYFDMPAVAVMKHLNPAGVGIKINTEENLVNVFEKAWNGDSLAAFGGVVGFNNTVDDVVAEKIIREKTTKGTQKYFIECLFAPEFTSEAMEILKVEERIRVVHVPRARQLLHEHLPYEIKTIGDSILLERPFYTTLKFLDDLKNLGNKPGTGVVTPVRPTEQQMQELLYAWWVCCEKRSNGVVIWKNDMVLGVGTGHQDRIRAIKGALGKAIEMEHDTGGSVLASDGFMMWDNVDPLGEAGVSAIIQPGGSTFDPKTKSVCEKYGIAMIFTGERVFRHF